MNKEIEKKCLNIKKAIEIATTKEDFDLIQKEIAKLERYVKEYSKFTSVNYETKNSTNSKLKRFLRN